MLLHVDDLELVILPGKQPPVEHSHRYQLAYDCWRGVWQKAYQDEMGIKERLYSDEFTRQDEVMALFFQGECAGLVFFRWVNFDESPAIQDSYFRCWPETALKKLCRDGKQILVCSQFTLNFKYRKNYLEFQWKDLLAALSTERLRYTVCSAMTGTMRLEKNMGETTYRVGAVPLLRAAEYAPGRFADLVAFYRESIACSSVPGIAGIVDALFSRVEALGVPFVYPQEVNRAA